MYIVENYGADGTYVAPQTAHHGSLRAAHADVRQRLDVQRLSPQRKWSGEGVCADADYADAVEGWHDHPSREGCGGVVILRR